MKTEVRSQKSGKSENRFLVALLLGMTALVRWVPMVRAQLAAPVEMKASASAGLNAQAGARLPLHIIDHQHFEARRCSDGLWEYVERAPGTGYYCWTIWTEDVVNTNTTAGLNDQLTEYWKGSSYTAAWYVGLKDTGSVVAGDTMASHSGWTEDTTYSESTRQVLTLGTASAGSIDNSASKAVFSINGTTTIYGAFLVTNNTKGGTTGTLWGGADFSSSRAVLSGDTLNVTITLTAS
jgi:hypothetical protein